MKPAHVITHVLTSFLITTLLGLGCIAYVLSHPEHTQGQVAPTTAEILLSSSSARVEAGETLSVDFYEDSGIHRVNAVAINLSYPTAKLEFVQIDTTAGEFEVQVQTNVGIGMIQIARGTQIPKTGKRFITRVILRAVQPTLASELAILSGSAVIETNSSANILTLSRISTPTPSLQGKENRE